MNKKDLIKKLKIGIAELCWGIEVESIKDGSRLTSDLNIDSLDRYEMVYRLEEELGITVPDDTALEWENDSIEEIADHILKDFCN